MPRIQKLPETVVRRIAAGEVVERPASVLKELVENSLDAGATRLTVEWEGAGRRLLRVTDDGRGIPAKEAALALERHATSKIASFDDLERVGTYGFRGEALPSIASVSRFRLVTRPAGAAEGWSVECEGGEVVKEGPCGAPPGTTVTVRDLFYCTPAREKFLKSDATERGQLLRAIEDIALAARHADFQVSSEGREALSLRAAPAGADPLESLRARLAAAWGEERLKGAKPLRQSGRFMTVWGWISDVHSSQSTARWQRLFVNGRPVLNRRLSHALYEAYRGALLVGRHPLAVLFLEVDPTLVDVNVHPAKREVRLSHEEEAHSFLYQALKAALSGSARMPSALPGDAARAPEVPPTEPARPPAVRPGLHRFDAEHADKGPTRSESRAAMYLQAPLSAHEPVAGSSTHEPRSEYPSDPATAEPASGNTAKLFREAKAEPLMQLDGTYILARLDHEFYIFDQHAAAERVLYERLSDAAQNAAPHRQALLLPWVWEVSAAAAPVVQESLAHFQRLGYELESFGAQSFRVKAVPGVLGDSPKVRTLLEGLADDLLTGAVPKEWDDILVRAACRGSVKANDALKLPEMAKILKDLQSCRHPWSCPHGRPTHLKLTGEELAKRFKRG
jgi:DNA mismatch repair protein MutL